MNLKLNPIVGIIPNVQGVGGPASFNEKLASGLIGRGVEITYDLTTPDISAVLVIAGTKHLATLARCIQRGVPLIQRLDGMNWVHRRRFTGVKHFLRSEVNNFIVKRIRNVFADKLIYQSTFTKIWWDRVYGEVKKPQTTIYNGVDLERYQPIIKAKRQDSTLNVIIVEGHIKNGLEVGLQNAISALDVFSRKTGRPVNLTIAGEVPSNIRLKLMKGRNLGFTWTGVVPRDEISKMVSLSDLFFSTEPNPACPNAVIEAMSCGLPVAAFDSGAIRELVPDDCGIVAPYGADIWKLQAAEPDRMVESLIANEDHLGQKGSNARKRVESHYSLDTMIDHYMEVLLR